MDQITIPSGLLTCFLLIPLRGEQTRQKQEGISHRGRSAMKRYFIAMLCAVLATSCIAADSSSVTISQNSLLVNGVELRASSNPDPVHYISFNALKKALGAPQATYNAGLGVTVYAWPTQGIQVQRGFRGEEKGKIFKFQVWFKDHFDKSSNTHSGAFRGSIIIDGFKLLPQTTLDEVVPKLKKAGFKLLLSFPKQQHIH